MPLRALAMLVLPTLLLAGCLEDEGSGGGGAPSDDAASPTAPTPGGTPTSATPPATPAPGSGSGDAEDVAWRTLAAGSRSGVRTQERLVLETEAEWQAFWARHGAEEPAPQVDFAQERVVAVTMGDKPNACWAVRVTGVAREAGSVAVEVTTYPPTPDMVCAQAVTQPFHVVAIPAGPEPVTFREVGGRGPPAETRER